MKLTTHKIASVTAHLKLSRELEVTRQCRAQTGDVIVVRALEEKRVYDKLELETGRMAKIGKGDVIVGALGRRRALRGFVGDVPEAIAVGDKLHILNLGGVIGHCTSENRDVGHPLQVEVLGMAMRDGRILNVADGALAPRDAQGECAPIIIVSGSCMNAGKTVAACEIVQKLAAVGYAVSGLKITGVACLRDTLNMEDHGARWTGSFIDCGLPSTAGEENLPAMAKALLADATARGADVIVAELGDGLITAYGSEALLDDPEIRAATRAHVCCANDLVAAWGAVRWLAERNIRPDVIAGPATDNEVGTAYVTGTLGIPARNSRTDPQALADLVEQVAFQHNAGAPSQGAGPWRRGSCASVSSAHLDTAAANFCACCCSTRASRWCRSQPTGPPASLSAKSTATCAVTPAWSLAIRRQRRSPGRPTSSSWLCPTPRPAPPAPRCAPQAAAASISAAPSGCATQTSTPRPTASIRREPHTATASSTA